MKQNRVIRSMCALGAAMLLCSQVGSSQDTTDASSSDKKFVHSALQGGNAEVKLGELAAQRGNSDDVKQFGQRMVSDHTRLSDRMKQIAQQEGIGVPDGIRGRDRALEMRLSGLSGDAFDKAFIEAMVLDHRKDLSEFQKEASFGNDTSIRNAASQGAQIIGEHLQLAEQMAQNHDVRTGNSPDSD